MPNNRPDFHRQVHCLLGLPFDAISLEAAVQHVRTAATKRTPCFLSTPNLNFLIAAQSDAAFRDSVINSDLSVADGMPIVWLAKLLGIPIRERVAGSNLFEHLRAGPGKLSVYFFGGMAGVAERACRQLNAEQSCIVCAGFESPGFGSIQELSDVKSIEKINSSAADFLVVSLGAKKGQAWIEHNRAQITAPVISHLGAVINFVAGELDRAPAWVQRLGFEWLWRIKEEPGLWRRYAADGLAFLKLLVIRIVLYAWLLHWYKPKVQELNSANIELLEDSGVIIVRLYGAWIHHNLRPLRECFSNLVLAKKDVNLDMENVTYVDSAFIGLVMLLHGNQNQHHRQFSMVLIPKPISRIMKYSGAEFLC